MKVEDAKKVLKGIIPDKEVVIQIRIRDKKTGNISKKSITLTTEDLEAYLKDAYEEKLKPKLPFIARLIVGFALNYVGELLTMGIEYLIERFWPNNLRKKSNEETKETEE